MPDVRRAVSRRSSCRVRQTCGRPAPASAARSEIYLYCGLPADGRVGHLMGQPDEVPPIIMAIAEAVIAPGWPVHCGAGTSAYALVWAMGAENQAFDDVDLVAVADLR
jgi:4-deoxy-L-threo-5-hexosulose-uronate ketol-isomerase